MKFYYIYRLLWQHFEFSIHNKFHLCNQILQPIWTYGVQLSCCTKKNKTIHKFLKVHTKRVWYMWIDDVYKNVNYPFDDMTKSMKNNCTNTSVEMLQRLDNNELLGDCYTDPMQALLHQFKCNMLNYRTTRTKFYWSAS